LEPGSRVDVYLFFSFDLVGSSRLKTQIFDRFHWVELIQYFYAECRRLIASRGVENAVVWKYLGDEVLFYERIGTAYEVEHSIRAIDRVLTAFMQELGESAKYSAAAEHLSIRAVAWIAPVLSFAENVSEKMTELVADLARADLLSGDQLVHDRENQLVEFLGPNVDTGFQLAASARDMRITISPALADFLRGSDRPMLDAIIEAGS